MNLPDGIDAFREVADPRVVATQIAATSRWASPEVFAYLPVWKPYTARREPLYKKGWVERQTNQGVPKTEGNVAANDSLTKALGLRRNKRRNWSCCHIWGNDDDTYQSVHSEVKDRRYFSCVANMILLPSPLKTFTDTVPEVKAALRFMAYRLYKFVPEGRETPTAAMAGEYLPKSWSTDLPEMVHPFNQTAKNAADRAAQNLGRLLETRPGAFPFEQTVVALKYWQSRKKCDWINDLLDRVEIGL